MEQVKQIWQEAGYPAPARLHALAKSKGITGITQKDIKEFVDSQAVSQLHKKSSDCKSSTYHCFWQEC